MRYVTSELEWWQRPELRRDLALALAPLNAATADGPARCRLLRSAISRLAALAGDEAGRRPAVSAIRALLGAVPMERRPLLPAAAVAAWRGDPAPGDPAALRRDLEALLEALLDRPSCRLASYGTLAPGRSNHHLLADLDGAWLPGQTRGRLRTLDDPAARGCRALDLDPDAGPVAAAVLESDGLPRRWRLLDAFEGPAYRRTLAVVELPPAGRLTVANLYAARRRRTGLEP